MIFISNVLEIVRNVRLRVDGILRVMDKYSKFLFENYSAVVARIKIISKLDIAERRVATGRGFNF